MSTKEIKEQICKFRNDLEELAQEAWYRWAEAKNEKEEALAYHLEEKLLDIADELAELENESDEPF